VDRPECGVTGSGDATHNADLVICSTCGTANEDGRKFCKECAAPLAVVCPTCGTPNAPDAKFCGECAAPLAGRTSGAATAAASQLAAPLPSPVAERRTVTVLFADLVGFTPFAEERDAEEVRDTLSRYFELASDVIVRYGGTVEKFIGDAVMAVWGAPAAHEDDAERAVRAGLELVDAVRVLGATIQARAGVLTGEAAVTLGATNQGMVAGDLVNTASRLESMTKEVQAQLVVSEALASLGQIDLSAYPRHDLAIRGREETLAVRAIPDAALMPALEPLKKSAAPKRREKEPASATA